MRQRERDEKYRAHLFPFGRETFRRGRNRDVATVSIILARIMNLAAVSVRDLKFLYIPISVIGYLILISHRDSYLLILSVLLLVGYYYDCHYYCYSSFYVSLLIG